MRKFQSSWSLIALAGLSGVAIAADSGIQAGPMRVLPTLGVTLSRDDNVLRTATDEVSSFVTQISPGLKVEAGTGATRFVFSYEGEYARYAESALPDSDYDDHRVAARVDVAASDRVNLRGGAFYTRGHDRRGEGAQQGSFRAAEIDQFRTTGGDVALRYGAPGARGLLEFTAGAQNLSYLNNRIYTQFRDRNDRSVGGLFGWRVGGRTSLLLSAAQRDISFDRTPVNGINRDSRERDLKVGVEFDATGMTSGRALFGRIEKDFDDARLDDFSGFGWSVGLQYRPRSYSVFDLSTSSATEESDDIINQVAGTSFSVRRMTTLAWTHGWTDRFKTGMDVGVGALSYRDRFNSGGALREDDIRALGASVSYQFREWLSVGAALKSYARSSNQDQFDYDQNLFLLSFEGTL